MAVKYHWPSGSFAAAFINTYPLIGDALDGAILLTFLVTMACCGDHVDGYVE